MIVIRLISCSRLAYTVEIDVFIRLILDIFSQDFNFICTCYNFIIFEILTTALSLRLANFLGRYSSPHEGPIMMKSYG